MVPKEAVLGFGTFLTDAITVISEQQLQSKMKWEQSKCRSLAEIQRALICLSFFLGRASCSASGDPHYITFDHRVHHFMGNCTYTLSKVCNVSERLPYFDVSTTNEHRGANTKVSYVKSVQVEIYGNHISLLKNKKVNVRKYLFKRHVFFNWHADNEILSLQSL